MLQERMMRSSFVGAVLLLGVGLGPGCDGARLLQPSSTALGFVVKWQESRTCELSATPQTPCTVTLTARVELVELEGRSWQISSVQGTVRDSRSGQDLKAVPATLTADEVRQLAGSDVLAANSGLTIPLELRFVIEQPPVDLDRPYDLQVVVMGHAL